MSSVVKSFQNLFYVQLTVALAQLRATAYLLPKDFGNKLLVSNDFEKKLQLMSNWGCGNYEFIRE